MRTPLCRARASSASLSGTPSSLRVTVRSMGDAASACCDRTGAVATTSIAAIARPQVEHQVSPTGTQRDAPRRDDDLHVVLLRIRAHVEAGPEIFGHALAGAHEEGTAGIVAHDEVRLAVELHGARAEAEVA